ncbi:hypothetical protein GV794_26510 [Nocardia cyriacigeorgica]|uniref:Asp23/Gls24 family envelope stress response protein n=1 Tax=Nocardia cyriacigeorgica TaxID=135487 RepID=A0A6P1D2N8_9NOCA|nr:hypothetical protein [Nocardia cyriacigeorgica]NEW40951.1 hypothetical protein [Nocardia cyriacigeorgica]NEW44258.1 hypothetical protein [Nocardia cyriacigeorgica]NEW51243.1 hypothetical protein [Nocardia cyriacigeorgica]NEW59160.1 hypothetical protein [Nocardia cyriacigeorgica]
MADEETIDKIIGAVEGISGLRPATPIVRENASWWPWDARTYAVDVTDDAVQVRVVAAALPLPPLLDLASEAIRPVLTGTPWEQATLRLVVTELDAAAFAEEGTVG